MSVSADAVKESQRVIWKYPTYLTNMDAPAEVKRQGRL